MLRLVSAAVALVAVSILIGCGGGGGSPSAPLKYTYLSAHNLSPGAILRVAGATEEVVLTRPSDSLTNFVLGGPTVTAPALPADWCYFCDAIDDRTVRRADGTIVYTHSTFLRDLAVGHDGALYFSESSGAGADGKIWRFDAAGVPNLYYTVPLAKVGGFFAGNFAFSPDGTLYISNGNYGGAGLWRCPVGSGTPTRVFRRTDDGSFAGFCFPDDGTVLFTDFTNKLRRATVGGGTVQSAFTTVFTSPASNSYRDVVQSATLYPEK